MIPVYAIDRESSRQDLRSKIANKYAVPNCHLFTSGTQAIYVVLDSLANYFFNGLFLISTYLYRGTQRHIIPELQRRYPTIQFKAFDCLNVDLNDLSTCRVLFLESCSNPHAYVWDPSEYVKLNPRAYLVIDNTWLSPATFNPFTYPGGQFKIVIDSCVKYISGGTCMMGSACFEKNDPLIDRIAASIKISGIQVATTSCQQVSTMLDSLDSRVAYSFARTQIALNSLKDEPEVDQIAYPSLVFRNGPSVCCIHIRTNNYQLELEPVIIAAGFQSMTSFAHPEDNIDTSYRWDETGVWLRIGFGYRETTDVRSKIHRLCALISE